MRYIGILAIALLVGCGGGSSSTPAPTKSFKERACSSTFGCEHVAVFAIDIGGSTFEIGVICPSRGCDGLAGIDVATVARVELGHAERLVSAGSVEEGNLSGLTFAWDGNRDAYPGKILLFGAKPGIVPANVPLIKAVLTLGHTPEMRADLALARGEGNSFAVERMSVPVHIIR